MFTKTAEIPTKDVTPLTATQAEDEEQSALRKAASIRIATYHGYIKTQN